MQRRQFLKASAAITAVAGLCGTSSVVAAEPSKKRELYELRSYQLKDVSDYGLLAKYLSNALLPALNRLESRPVGVFKEMEPKEGLRVFVLIPFATFEAFGAASEQVPADPEYQKAGADYLQVAKSKPAFVRINSWLLRAFAGIPKISLPAYCQEKKSRMFELRIYESYSEVKAQTKVDMFNDGEIQTMQDVGLGPIFFGQALIGQNLPHLAYMLSAENRELHKEHWNAFGVHPTWKKMSSDPKYADTVSKITNYFLEPAEFSQI